MAGKRPSDDLVKRTVEDFEARLLEFDLDAGIARSRIRGVFNPLLSEAEMNAMRRETTDEDYQAYVDEWRKRGR